MTSIAVIGAGYVGLTTAVCLAEWGHDVRSVEIDRHRYEMLCSGRSPISEPDIDDLIVSGIECGLLSFWDDPVQAVDGCDVVMLCVATPQSDDGSSDLRYVHDAVIAVRDRLMPGSVMVLKSTMPIGGSDLVSDWLSRSDVYVVSNPEFLRQSSAVRDVLNPDRVVIGASDYDAAQRIIDLYDHLGCPIIWTDPVSAETIKYVSNAYLAMRVSYVNSVSVLCDEIGASIDEVMLAMGMDHRIGSQFLQPSLGWGGSCFPKDIASLQSVARAHGYEFALLDQVVAANDEQIRRVSHAIIDAADSDVVAVLGMTFKAGTDDLRGSPAMRIIDALLDAGIRVRAYDPAITQIDRDDIMLCSDAVDACDGASVVAVLTEWTEFAVADPEIIGSVMTQRSVVDGRNCLSERDWIDAGFRYRSIGRLR